MACETTALAGLSVVAGADVGAVGREGVGDRGTVPAIATAAAGLEASVLARRSGGRAIGTVEMLIGCDGVSIPRSVPVAWARAESSACTASIPVTAEDAFEPGSLRTNDGPGTGSQARGAKIAAVSRRPATNDDAKIPPALVSDMPERPP
jgi:hypothetical protein